MIKDSPSADVPGPRRVTSLHARGVALAEPREQRRILAELSLAGRSGLAIDFDGELKAHECGALRPGEIEIFQINLGHLCNMACRHCHVDAGPDRTDRVMSRATVEDCLRALEQTAAHTVDITGGAPEMNPSFTYLVDQVVARKRQVIDRCNLTILEVPQFHDLPAWFAERGVEIIASLPHFAERNTEAQRGTGTFALSIAALRRLNAVGYGSGDPSRRLTLMANPGGAFLAGDQRAMEGEWRERLGREHDVTFDRLIALNNMPCARFLEWLQESGNLDGYMERLVAAFNPAAVAGVMCRNTLSIAWDGRIFDCDFNQMLDLPIRTHEGAVATVRNFDPAKLADRRIRTGRHCFGCVAGRGSSCGGATVV